MQHHSNTAPPAFVDPKDSRAPLHRAIEQLRAIEKPNNRNEVQQVLARLMGITETKWRTTHDLRRHFTIEGRSTESTMGEMLCQGIVKTSKGQDGWTLERLDHFIDQFEAQFKVECRRQRLYKNFQDTVLTLPTYPSDKVEILRRSLLDLEASDVWTIYLTQVGGKSALYVIEEYGHSISRYLTKVRGESETESLRLAEKEVDKELTQLSAFAVKSKIIGSRWNEFWADNTQALAEEGSDSESETSHSLSHCAFFPTSRNSTTHSF